MSSLFTKIINGEIPSHKIYEDDNTFVFLDIFPVTAGHMLVVPKLEIDRLEDLPEDKYLSLMKTVKKMMSASAEYSGKKRVCLKLEGFDVLHAHVHVFACDDAKDFYSHPDRTKEPDHKTLEMVAEQLRRIIE